MPSWKKIITSGSSAALGSLTVTNSVTATSFTGSLQGSASYALTASFALNAGGGAAFPFTGSAIISGSLTVTGSLVATSFTGSIYSPKTVTDGTLITSTTSNTLAGSVFVPANTFAAGDFIKIFARVKKTTTTSSTRIRLYVNTSNSLSGATQIADSNASQFLRIASMERTFMVKNVTTDTEGLESAAIAFTDIDIAGTTLQGNAVQSYSIDWTTNQYIITAVQPNALPESQRLSGMYVMKI
jgi:hypothetical protein